ncbi:MAG TPA: transposase [Candidatus Brocadiia bacterium]|nr:transposase [Candidatus Brocadiia bacterium]
MGQTEGRKPRKNYTPEEKLQMLKRHIVDRVPVSDICDHNQLDPNVFYRWMKQFWENGAVVFERERDKPSVQMQRRVDELQQQVTEKNGVIAELLAAHMELKKRLGGTERTLAGRPDTRRSHRLCALLVGQKRVPDSASPAVARPACQQVL